MLELNADLRPIINMARRFKNALVVGCVGTVGGATIGIYRLRQLYDTHEIIAMGVAVIAVSACGRYALIKTKQAIHGESTPIRDFIAMVRRLFGTPEAIEVGDDWVDQMVRMYRPGRNLYALPIGVTESGSIVEASMMESESHLIVQGASGYGKSYLVNQIILGAALTGLYQVVLIGKSTKDFAAVSKMQNVHTVRLRETNQVDTDDEMGNSYPEKLLKALNSAYMHLCTRQKLLEEKEVSSMVEIRKRDRPQSILLVIDEFSNAVLSADNMSTKLSRQLQGRVTQIAQEGRAVNMHLLLVGQRAAAVIDKRLRAQMVSIVYRTKDANESYLATGSKTVNAHELIVGDPKKGRPHQIAICDERRNRYAFVPPTPPADFHR
ncbi:MAG: FtsK/SpoIIIE domain-containing protein, partial [Chloroflexota bacterium]